MLLISISAAIIDGGHLLVKSSYICVIIGGALTGAGFAITDYCPATGRAAIGTGRKDALVFVIGGLCGWLLYMFVYGSTESSWLLNDIAGGKVMLAEGSDKYAALIPAVPGVLLAAGLGVAFMLIAWKLPEIF